MTTRDPLAELDAWKMAKKSRSVQILHDDGYGASDWEIELNEGFDLTTKRYLNISEVTLMREAEIAGEELDWPGLPAVILAALDRWETDSKIVPR